MLNESRTARCLRDAWTMHENTGKAFSACFSYLMSLPSGQTLKTEMDRVAKLEYIQREILQR